VKPPLTLRSTTFSLNDGSWRWPAEAGWLEVPARHGEDTGKTYALPVLRLRSSNPKPSAPIVYLSGGPGIPGTEDLAYNAPGWKAYLEGLLSIADVITFDQRGCGGALPNLDAFERWNLPLDQALTEVDVQGVALERACTTRTRLESEGIDWRTFTTKESAHDVNLLREALGLERVRLMGFSYGTHLAMAVLRYHSEYVQCALLEGAEGPDHTHKLPSNIEAHLHDLDALLKDDKRWQSQLPSLLEPLKEILETLAKKPMRVSVKQQMIEVGNFDLQLALSSCFGSRNEQAAIPRHLIAMLRGDYSWLAELSLEFRQGWFLSGMQQLIDCASGASLSRREKLEAEAKTTLLGNAINTPFPFLEKAWDNLDVGAAFRAPLETSVPTLFSSGILDGRTPLSNATDLRPGFSNANLLVVEGAAHQQMYDVPLALKTQLEFLSHQNVSDTTAKQLFRFAPPKGTKK
jgi:pimeloyl-ACP methyl ester carboxylesterase